MLVPEALTDERHRAVLGHFHQIDEQPQRLPKLLAPRRELAKDDLVYPGVRGHDGHERAALAQVILSLRLVRYPHAVLGNHPLDEFP